MCYTVVVGTKISTYTTPLSPLFWVLKIVPALPWIFRCAQDDILLIINALCGDASVKNSTRIRGVALLLRVLKLVPINTQLYVCYGC